MAPTRRENHTEMTKWSKLLKWHWSGDGGVGGDDDGGGGGYDDYDYDD